MAHVKEGAVMAPVIVVLLRQPRLAVSTEMRSDPFWEFASFGSTGCHNRNLMHPGKAHLLEGVRLAFAQGGEAGFKLVYVTPPIDRVRPYADGTEVRWDPPAMPFRYDSAPVLIDPDGRSDIPELARFVREVNRNGWLGKFASKFRSRREQLPAGIARRLLQVYNRRLSVAVRTGRGLAATYEQALPVNPPLVDRNRRLTYSGLVSKVEQSAVSLGPSAAGKSITRAKRVAG